MVVRLLLGSHGTTPMGCGRQASVWCVVRCIGFLLARLQGLDVTAPTHYYGTPAFQATGLRANISAALRVPADTEHPQPGRYDRQPVSVYQDMLHNGAVTPLAPASAKAITVGPCVGSVRDLLQCLLKGAVGQALNSIRGCCSETQGASCCHRRSSSCHWRQPTCQKAMMLLPSHADPI